jgi:hypothetical protein
MPWQTEVVAASRHAAQAIADMQAPSSTHTGFIFNGFDRVKLGTLLCLIAGDDALEHFDEHLQSLEIVTATHEEWPMITVIDAPRVAALAELAAWEHDAFHHLVHHWSATDEFEDWGEADVDALLHELVYLAATAKFKQQCLLIWQAP